MKLQLVFALMGILLTRAAPAHEVQGEAPTEFQPLVLDQDPLLDVRAVEKGVMTPDRGCWMDAPSCVWVSHYCRSSAGGNTTPPAYQFIGIGALAAGLGAILGWKLRTGAYLP